MSNLTTKDIEILHPSARNALLRQILQRGVTTVAARSTNTAGIAALRAARVPGQMTRTEIQYRDRLAILKLHDGIRGWDYECVRLRLANPVAGGRAKWFLTDFTVYHADGRISFDEVKGSWASEKGIERFRWLCDRYPHLWLRLWVYDRGTWELKYESGRAG